MARGYVTWIDMKEMKGAKSVQLVCLSLMPAVLLTRWCAYVVDNHGHTAGSITDGMSYEVENAAVMLYGVSETFKESANVRSS